MDILQEFIRNKNEVIKVAISSNYGSFALTKEMCETLQLDFKNVEHVYMFGNNRSNPVLIDLIEKLKPEDISIVEIEWWDLPNSYLIDNDGKESVENNCSDGYPLVNYLFDGKYRV